MTASIAWRVADPPDSRRAGALADALNIPNTLAELLLLRGYENPEAAKGFLRPSVGGLSDPSDLVDLPKAAKLMADAVRAGETMLVHGDYDVDGQCAAALLTRVVRIAGGHAVPFVPHRVRDGYDLGPAGVAAAEEHGASLIVTCDCGITAFDAVADAKRRGLRVIITDHHLPGSQLPVADAVVNPRRSDCPSHASGLCGAGVAFKLVQALVVELGLPENLPLHFLDLVALATVADMVPLVGENRILVRNGLKKLAASRWPGVRALVEVAGLGGKPVRAGHVGYVLAPRLNAVGRIADAMDGLRLLLNDDERTARDQARELESLNARRRALDQEILEEAVKQIDESTDLDDTFGLVLASDAWHAGVIGIVASRVVERYARPTFLIALDGDEGKGSGRSVPGFDLHAALSECASHLVKYGGHRMAAGLTVTRDRLDAFKTAFDAAVRSKLTKEDLVGTQRIDALVSVDQLDRRLERLLRHLEPCGLGNPAPVFAVKGARVRTPREVGHNHLKFMLEDGTGQLSAIGFDLVDRIDRDWLGGEVDVAFRFEENEWSGGSTLQARVVGLRPSG